ncbi:MAG TPA: hypothetical protein VJ281_08570 [Chthoniobacterales bacterium]|jgi:hypothetical protein|nr:hypothetical protein [Chthoniobacterales bacterium]
MALRPFVFVAAISLAALAVGSNSDIAVISQYVISHKSWPAKVFRVERKECDCAYALYRIIYLPEDGKLPAANSKSFAVYYDEQRHRIVKETPFQ